MNRLKYLLAAPGIALALAAVALDNRLVGWVAMAILGGSVLLGMAERRRARLGSQDEPGDGPAGHDPGG